MLFYIIVMYCPYNTYYIIIIIWYIINYYYAKHHTYRKSILKKYLSKYYLIFILYFLLSYLLFINNIIYPVYIYELLTGGSSPLLYPSHPSRLPTSRFATLYYFNILKHIILTFFFLNNIYIIILIDLSTSTRRPLSLSVSHYLDMYVCLSIRLCIGFVVITSWGWAAGLQHFLSN